MITQQKLTAEFSELDRVTPRPLTHEDYAIAAMQFFQSEFGELSKAQERIALLEQVLRECRALMRFGKNDIDRSGPIWQQIEDALKP